MKLRKFDIITSITAFLFLLLLVLILVVDVRVNELTGEKIGLFELNNVFLKNTINHTFDIISDIILDISVGCIIFYMIMGLIQIFKKNEPSNEIIFIGIMMIVIIVIWIVFDKFLIINHRPIYITMELEGSFPSTHVIITTFVMLVNIALVSKNIKKKNLRIALYIANGVVILASPICRLLSNMHWFTDILGGVLLGALLFELYYIIIRKKDK